MPINPVAFHIGPWPVYWYGILIALSLLVGTVIAYREAQRRGDDPDIVLDGLLVVAIFGLVGARLYHVIHQWDTLYKSNPVAILYIWNGGLAIYGGLIGGIIGLFLYTRARKLDFLHWADLGGLVLPLGQAIGRWGNFINQEQYGAPTDLPWAIYIEPQYRVPGYEGYDRFHPLFLYESIWNLIVFGILMYLWRRKRTRLIDGDIFFLYSILYSLGRIVLESIKLGDTLGGVWTIAGIRAAQLVGFAFVLICGFAMIYRHRQAVRLQMAQKADRT
jgi:phosphatidylglycerol:prolipoprotein diacylglycerol transferase